MITILQITPSYKPAYIYGGPTRSISKLCEELVNTPLRIKVLTTTANGHQELPVRAAKTVIVDRVEVQYFKRFTKDPTHFSPALLWQLVKLIRTAQRQPSAKIIIHVHSWWNIVSLSTLLVAKWYHVPVVLSARGMLTSYSLKNRHSLYKSILHHIVGKSLLGNLCIHATTAKEATDIRSLSLGHRKIYTIPNMVSLPAMPKTKLSTIPQHVLQLLFLSRIEEKKGLAHLFAALSKLTFPWTLSIAGSGEQGYIVALKKLTKALNIQHQIKWLGQIGDDTKFDLLSESDFLLLPSFNENFANVVVESLSVGTPVIISPDVGLADYVAEHGLGWVSSTDSISLINCIHLAAGDHKKRAFIRQEGPRIIGRDYSPKAILLDYVNMYEQVLQYGS